MCYTDIFHRNIFIVILIILFVKEYNKFFHNFFESAVEEFAKEVRSKKFPNDEYSYSKKIKNIRFLNLKKK